MVSVTGLRLGRHDQHSGRNMSDREDEIRRRLGLEELNEPEIPSLIDEPPVPPQPLEVSPGPDDVVRERLGLPTHPLYEPQGLLCSQGHL